ncbi:MAG TPA: pantoate--beta-alanine ligase [Spirochaetota bacterium]|nr:pantoate--beta-alanine ligase [Spirochaetota bacterium]HPI90274.1 pantoate--beta-alanine ligase [Spirochaetota bacterium]HPR46388.1 pantoate--beta-alanine ligase [Spirochaetota bacterium]
MEIVKKIDVLRLRINRARKDGKRIGFVPTMGYLHRGHLSLVDESKKYSDYQVMSIFVNRIQFNDPKDFSSYPVDLERDFDLARGVGVDLIFLPDEDEMYRNNLTFVDVATLTDNLCGAHRPGHFRGVFTVVSKLFNIVQPDVSVFGQKDIQQAVSIQKMVDDLNIPVRIIIAPIIREDDGLAMSSRNKHLNPVQRKNALVLNRSLGRARDRIMAGEKDFSVIRNEMEQLIMKGEPEKIDYISAVRFNDLALCDRIDEKSVIAVAVFFGTTRLIDNMIIDFSKGKPSCVL